MKFVRQSKETLMLLRQIKTGNILSEKTETEPYVLATRSILKTKMTFISMSEGHGRKPEADFWLLTSDS